MKFKHKILPGSYMSFGIGSIEITIIDFILILSTIAFTTYLFIILQAREFSVEFLMFIFISECSTYLLLL